MKKSSVALPASMGLAAVGLVLGGFAVAWLAGSLGISAAAASQIVSAIEVGGWALTAVAATFGLGIGGAVIATARWYLVRRGRAVAIA